MRYHLAEAWTGDTFEEDVVVTVRNGMIASVEVGVPADPEMVALEGVAFPGFHNDHSHVFHRILRGHVGRGDFWTWREEMYRVGSELDPDSYRAIALATYREMVAAGFTSVTEFHYLHHRPDGKPYDDPNVMADAVAQAAAEAGIRLTLLDTCYLSGGFGRPPEGVQVRFSDGTVEAWAERVSAWKPPAGVTFGAAIHSVRAVNPRQMGVVVEWAEGRPLHVHASEQSAENKECLNHYGRTPVEVLIDAGVAGPRVTHVHATHASPSDIGQLASTRTTICVCPTTERWLADGIGPTGAAARAGIRLTVGSDSQATIDPFEEMRLLELHQRLATGKTGTHSVSELLVAGTAGRRFEPGAPADIVVIATDSHRTAGVPTEGLVFAASTADVTAVVIDGRLLRR